MLFPIKHREYLAKIEKLAPLHRQVEEIRNKLGKQNNHGDTKILFEAITGTIRKTIENLTKTITETSIKNNEAISDLNENSLELMNDKGMIAPNLASSLVYLFKPEKKVNLN